MSWAKLDDHANENPKLLKAGAKAAWLWACGLMYCNRQRKLFISRETLRELCPARNREALAKKLVNVGLWDAAEDGYYVLLELWGFGAKNQWSRIAYREVFERDGFTCRYCKSTADLTIDHVVPRCQGGDDLSANLVVACRSCNGRKGGRTPEQAGMVLL